MTAREGGFPEYGGSGDTVGARRVRHAWRFAVLAGVLFTFTLWFAEGYLRYSRPERLYRMALLHEDDSARAILRNLVPKGEVPQDSRLARQLAALAFIEDGTWDRARQGIYEEYAVDPVVLERYAQAHAADREDGYIMTLYGCALFQDGQFSKARDMFRDARRVARTDDALPTCLEAAARIHLDEWVEALELVRQVNANPDMRLLFPEPLWHPSYPRDGMWYVKMRQRVIERVLGPLAAMKTRVCEKAQEVTPSGVAASVDWSAWLRELTLLGQRLVGDARSPDNCLGTLQARAGLMFQRDACELLARRPGEDSAALRAQMQRIDRADEELRAFEQSRGPALLAHEIVVRRPFRVCLLTGLLLTGVYALAYLFAKIRRSGRVSWSLPHPRWSYLVIVAGALLQLCILAGLTAVIRVCLAPNAALEVLTWLFHAVTAALIALGLFYPAIALPSARTVAAGASANGTDRLDEAYAARRTAYASLLRRYYGMLTGAFIFTCCIWTLFFRITIGLYPFLQAKLLTTGLSDAEVELVRHVQKLLF